MIKPHMLATVLDYVSKRNPSWGPKRVHEARIFKKGSQTAPQYPQVALKVPLHLRSPRKSLLSGRELCLSGSKPRTFSLISPTLQFQDCIVHRKNDISIPEISIVLTGHSKSEIIRRESARGPLGIASSQTYRQKVTLFTEKHVLFQGPSNLPTNHSWPFTFTLPKNCGAATLQIRAPETYRLVNDQENNPLPPSFESCHLSQRLSCYI